MRAWWMSLEVRERRTLVAGMLLLLALGLWAGVWEPLEDERARLQELRAMHLEDLQWMRGAAAELRGLKGSSEATEGSSGRSLLALVDISTKAVGITDQVENIQPVDDERVMVSLSAVGFDVVARWLGWLRGRGVEAASLDLQRIELTPRVNGRITLARAVR